jgi:hypothetical protein
MTYKVVLREENFRGMSYGSWVARWSNWLLSEQSYSQSDVLFLRGNVAWKPSEGEGGQLRIIPPGSFLDRRGDLCEKIDDHTPVFIPIITAMYFIGDRYEGRVLENEEQIRYAARNDINEGGPMYAQIKQGTGKFTKIVNNLENHMVESPLFKLMVSEKSPLLDYLEYPMTPGIYDAVTVGYFLILRGLNSTYYQIQFGGKGRGYYRTDSVYDIIVTPKNQSQDLVTDISPGSTSIKLASQPRNLPYSLSIPPHPKI